MIVGGLLRDLLWDQTTSANTPLKSPWDMDLVVPPGVSAFRLAEALAHHTNGHLVPLDPSMGIYRVILSPQDGETSDTVDVCDCVGKSFQEDLRRRDFTLNAMGLVLTSTTPGADLSASWLDPLGGANDMANHHLRLISETNLTDDPLRLLRAFRFQAWLGPQATLDPALKTALHRHAALIQHPAGERVHVELLKLLSQPHAHPAMAAMAESGVLEALFPDLTAMRQVPPNTHHHLWLWDHTLELLRQSDLLFPTLPEAYQQHLCEPVTPFANRLALVRLAALFHDVGKPETWVIQENNRHTFYGHDRVSAEMFEAVARHRLKLGGTILKQVSTLIRWHLYPCQITPNSTPKAIARYLRRLDGLSVDLAFLGMIDTASTCGPARPPEVLTHDLQNLRWLMDEWHRQRTTLKTPPLLDGNQIMALLALPPGPHIGKLLKALKEAQLSGEITTPDEGVHWLRLHVKNPSTL